MDDDKNKAEPAGRRARKGGGGMFWMGLIAGLVITAVIFHRHLFEFVRDATGNVMPVFFTPGLLEVSLGVIGFSLVIVINFLLRREQDDEWVELPDEEE